MKLRIFAASLGLLLLPIGRLWAEEGGGHAEEGIPFSLLFSVINFLILVALLVYFLKKPTKEFFASRSTLIRTNLRQAQELKTHAERKYSEYEARLEGIEQEMQKLIHQLEKDGELERIRLIQAAQDQVRSLHETSGKILTQEIRKAKEELKHEAILLASQLAEKLIRKNLTAQDQERIISQYLQEMERSA